VAYGVIRHQPVSCKKNAFDVVPTVTKIVLLHPPDSAGGGKVVFSGATSTQLSWWSQAAGVNFYLAGQAGVPIAEYNPMQVKQAGRRVRRCGQVAGPANGKGPCWTLEEIPRPDDAADARRLLLHPYNSSRSAKA